MLLCLDPLRAGRLLLRPPAKSTGNAEGPMSGLSRVAEGRDKAISCRISSCLFVPFVGNSFLSSPCSPCLRGESSYKPSFFLLLPLGVLALVLGRQRLARAERLDLQAGQVQRLEVVVQERLGRDRDDRAGSGRTSRWRSRGSPAARAGPCAARGSGRGCAGRSSSTTPCRRSAAAPIRASSRATPSGDEVVVLRVLGLDLVEVREELLGRHVVHRLLAPLAVGRALLADVLGEGR